MTKEQLTAIASSVGPREFYEFADAVSAIDPVLGATVQLHAEAADGNSPDVSDWVRHTLDDAAILDATTVGEAREWWMNRYAPMSNQ